MIIDTGIAGKSNCESYCKFQNDGEMMVKIHIIKKNDDENTHH